MKLIWINGAFGVGKTQTAYALQRRLTKAFVFDPENAGYYLRKNLPEGMQEADFQDHALWRTINRDVLAAIAAGYDGVILVPMTVTDPRYFAELTALLPEGEAFLHVILLAERRTLLRRLGRRLEGKRSWAAAQIDRCIQAFSASMPGARLQTDRLDIEQTAEEIARMAGLTLAADRRSALRRMLDRLWVQLRHIR